MKISPLILALALAAAFGSAQAEERNCKIKLDSNDQMQYDQKSITVSASCETIEIELNHVGKLPVTAMGHNVIIAATADAQAVANDGLKAGADKGYLQPDDARVIASTKMIGGGESATASFKGSALKAGGEYSFFCSFPGHFAIMKGTLVVTP